jgi:hypothetical protein
MSTPSGRNPPSPDDRKSSSSSARNDAASRNFIAVARGSDLVVIRVVGKGNMVNAPALADFADEQRKLGFSRFVFDMERCQGLDSTFMGVMVGMHAAVASESGELKKVIVESRRPAAPPKDEPAAQAAASMVGAGDDMTPMNPEDAARELAEKFPDRPAAAESQRPAPEPVPAAAEAAPSLISAVNVPSHVQDLMSMLGVDKFVRMRGNCELGQLETTILPEKQINPTERRRLILKAHETLVEIDKRNEAQFGAFLKTLSSELAKE